jgi:hypothetical protein
VFEGGVAALDLAAVALYGRRRGRGPSRRSGARNERGDHQTRQPYTVRLDLGRGPDGKRTFKYHSGYATKRAAQQARTELLGALERRS